MPSTATITATNPFAGTCPPGNVYDNVVTILNSNTNVDVEDAGSSSNVSFFRQANAPTPGNGIFWKRIDNDPINPAPLGEYAVYNGRWVIANPPPIGTIWAMYDDPTGLFDSSGKGLFTPSPNTTNIAGKWYGFAICNGRNGTPALSNTFPLAAEKWDDPTNKWVAKAPITGGDPTYQSSGGSSGILLNSTYLPDIPVREYDSTGSGSFPAIYGGNKFTATDGLANPRAGQGVEMQIPDNYPLFRAIPFIQFQGYGN